jgi:hypothetical protein
MQQYHNHSSFFWRALKVTPIIGMFFVLANAGKVFRRKGYVFGTVELALDLCPVICIIKASIEAYKGDLIPEKTNPNTAQLNTTAELA